jgi:ATP-dependent Clp protease ATP-binding subunit ClpA
MDALKESFRPEFLNRIDETVIFNYLKKDQIKMIVDLELAKVEKRLQTKEIKIQISDKAKDLLIKEGFDPSLGARPLKRIIQKLILDPLSVKIVTNEIFEGSRVLIDEKDGKIDFEIPKALPKFPEKLKLAKAKR